MEPKTDKGALDTNMFYQTLQIIRDTWENLTTDVPHELVC